MDHDQILGSWGDWATRYAGALFGKVQTGTWVTDVRAFMEFFNAPQMDWFIDTPNVKSYEQQMEIRARFLKNRHRYHLEIAGPGWKDPVKWDEHGTTAHFTQQTENWYEPIPVGWSKCQFPKPYSEHILNNAIGQPVVWVLTDRDLMFHVNRKGQVDSFRIVPTGMIRYSVKKAAKCWLDPGGSDAKVDPFIPFTPSMSAPSNGHEVGCPRSMFAGVVVKGTPCYLDYLLVKKAQKQDRSPPKSWEGYTESVILPAQPAP
jgi:hypothetical protein